MILLLGVMWPSVPGGGAEIAGVLYINLDRSVVRRERFLCDYARHPIAGLTPVRFPGIIPNTVDPPPRIGYGMLGAALGHLSVLNHIMQLDPNKWYLVCEDDASGRFSDLPALLQKTTRQRLLMPEINVINLYTHWHVPYGMGTRTTAYLVTPDGARWMEHVILSTL